MGVFGNIAPAGTLRHKEDVVLQIGIRVVFKALALCHQLRTALLKGRRDIAQEDQADNDLPVLGSGDRAPQNACRVPELFFKSEICLCFFCHSIFPRYIQIMTDDI